jgi:diketogulonate reductase-like aldo/keto reductase
MLRKGEIAACVTDVDGLKAPARHRSVALGAADDEWNARSRRHGDSVTNSWHRLNDGYSIPQLGLGTWQIDDVMAPQIVEAAIGRGYRLIDTAANYRNESGIGRALNESALPRNNFVVTTKLWNDSHGYDQTLRAFDASTNRLRLEVVDLYLIHWPLPQHGLYVDTWRAFIELRKQGRVRSIGVSNFTAQQLERIVNETGVVPALKGNSSSLQNRHRSLEPVRTGQEPQPSHH